ncbi:MAG: GNAT family N-acetyltransferase [Eubacteriales bacterium]|nr:GNAT family N-acetyltransferase [Eubacteriales bacterium]
MEFLPVSTAQFDDVYALMNTAFPYAEHRGQQAQRALLARPEYRLYRAVRDGSAVGLLGVWTLPGWDFVEHLAIDPTCRSGGLGSELMRSYLAGASQPVVLEVEPPEAGEWPRRRVGFYQRLGFHFCPLNYAQPPLRPDTALLPLRLMTWPNELDEASHAAVRALLYRHVYGLPEGRLPSSY